MAKYFSALYHESNLVEDWEATKSEADMEYYDWNHNKSKVSATEILNSKSESAEKIEPPQDYAKSVEELLNDGENDYNLDKYKEQVVKMLGLNIAWHEPSPKLASVPPISVELKVKKQEKENFVEPEVVEKAMKKVRKVKKEKRKVKEEEKPTTVEVTEEIPENLMQEIEVNEDKKSGKVEKKTEEKSAQRTFWFHP